MKEASGEANMTVITIVLIALVLAAGYFIVNNMMNSANDTSEEITNGYTTQGDSSDWQPDNNN